MIKSIIVNATALHQSGALSILKQFIENIPEDNTNWLIFIPESVQIEYAKENVRLEPIHGVKPMHKRLWWDAIGLERWLKRNGVEPVAAISLQNTGYNVGKKVPSFLYYHQPIPFYPFKWYPFKAQEKTFWFYKNIYPFFVKLFLKKDTEVFVQLDFIKQGFAKTFNHPIEKIGVYFPKTTVPENPGLEAIKDDCLRLLFPAMPHFYKNHRVIEEAVKEVTKQVKVLFTFDCPENADSNLKVEYLGMQPYDKICRMYYEYDALVFPSYIETFGLPLLEAALTGMPIIVADLPYAREVLAGYKGVSFVPYENPTAWSDAINKLEKGKRYEPISIASRPGWKELFDKIKRYI